MRELWFTRIFLQTSRRLWRETRTGNRGRGPGELGTPLPPLPASQQPPPVFCWQKILPKYSRVASGSRNASGWQGRARAGPDTARGDPERRRLGFWGGGRRCPLIPGPEQGCGSGWHPCRNGGPAVLIGGRTHQEAGFLVTNPAVLESHLLPTHSRAHQCGVLGSAERQGPGRACQPRAQTPLRFRPLTVGWPTLRSNRSINQSINHGEIVLRLSFRNPDC